MAGQLVRIAAPLIVGAAAGIGAIIGASLARDRAQLREIEPPGRPLAFEGWWSSDASSSLAHAHPAVLMVDATSARVIDSWDRRRRARVEHPVVRRTPEWPREGVIVVDAATGDLLTVVSPAGPAGMPAA
ncbi:hypothetical protein [Agrococcus beijingensis]|uniref:hypothetical protein n=1 Tax=Agrococcus beijingensis TaxID=3068634 RepID=UPI002742017F|nr:hypothetical protein [Agrococcus sp. REN33]